MTESTRSPKIAAVADANPQLAAEMAVSDATAIVAMGSKLKVRPRAVKDAKQRDRRFAEPGGVF